jgi:hypothetical protein
MTLKLPPVRKINTKSSSIPSPSSDFLLHWEPPPKPRIECKSLLPTPQPNELVIPNQLKICVNQQPLKQVVEEIEKPDRLMVTRRYHGKLPELVRNNAFFTIQGYSLPASMAHMAKYSPRTPRSHEHFMIKRCPLFQSKNATPIPTIVKSLKSKSRTNSDYINKARCRVEQIDKLYESWPWKAKTAFSKPKRSPSPSREISNTTRVEQLPTNPSRRVESLIVAKPDLRTAIVATTSSTKNHGSHGELRVPLWYNTRWKAPAHTTTSSSKDVVLNCVTYTSFIPK